MGSQVIVAGLDRRPDCDVGIDRIVTLILQSICADLVDETDPAALVIGEIDHHP